MCVSCVNIPAKLNLIAQQSNDNVVHFLQLGKADGFASQTLNPCSEIQVLPLYLLCVSLANLVFILEQLLPWAVKESGECSKNE